MCTWAMRSLLLRSADRCILIDTGIGNKQDDKFRAHFEPHGPQSLFGSLQALGISRDDVTDVFLTHLHFDHCGGALWREEDGQITASFPRATYWSNERHFQWAMHPNAREKASFLKENFLPLYENGMLKFIPETQDVAFLPGFSVRFTYGHTEAMMSPLVETQVGPVRYCADVIPSQWHIGLPYVMAYDIRPLHTLEEKEALLREACEHNHLLMLEHDPVADVARVAFDASGRIQTVQTGLLSEF
jgi:glyoxylase-like metal-dependent hydrolase (beta-lactamase superfamily II)